MTPDAPVLLAHHALIIAVPFVVPAVIVSAVVGLVVWRDRHAPEELAEDVPGADPTTDTAQSTDGRTGG